MMTTINKTEPRLAPVENPKSIKVKLAYKYLKKKMGKVITPAKVHNARFPDALGLMKELNSLENKFTIDSTLNILIKVYIATINGCAFCIDIAKAHGNEQNSKGAEIYDDLLKFEESDKFSESEKAALAYVEEATRNKHIADATFERLQQHFSEEEIIQITYINAVENFYNLMNAPLNIGSDELCDLWSKNGK